MALTAGYELATDAQFKELSNYTTPPRAGRVTAIEASGQVRVETDDPDGGDVLAWPLNGFSYAVNDVVYVVFAVNSPDSALVIGSIAPLPTLDGAVVQGDLDLRYGRLAAPNTWSQNQTVNSTQTTGSAMAVTRNLAAASTNAPVVAIVQDHASDDQVALTVRQDAAADVAQFAGNGATTRVDQFGNFYTDGVNPTAGLTGTGVVSLRHYKSDGSGKDWRIDQNRNTSDGSLEFTNVTDYAGAARLRAVLSPSGELGLGVADPGGKLHAHDGTGGMVFVTKTGVVAVAQTVIPDGAGDVVYAWTGFLVVRESGGGVVASAITVQNGTNLDVVVGGFTLRIAVAANGAMTVIRQAGAGTATVLLMGAWL